MFKDDDPMPLSVEDFRDLVRLLEERPEWRAELRRLLLTDDLLSLPQVVRELIEAQRRTEARVAELAEAQARTEERVTRVAEGQARTEAGLTRVAEALNRLAEAQARTEERVTRVAEGQARTEAGLTRVAEALNRLAEAQARTDERVARLAEAQARTEERVTRLAEALNRLAEAQARTEERVADLNVRVGHLTNLLGADIESDAEDVLLWVFRGKGYQPGEPRLVDVNGDLDVALPIVDGAGRQLWALAEAKVRVRRSEVLGWVRKLRDPDYFARLRGQGIVGPYLAYVFGLRVYDEAVAAASEHGVGVVNPRGERVSPVERA